MSVLTGPAIATCIQSNEIIINPFDPNQINPTSYDLRLGNKVRIYCGDMDPVRVIYHAKIGYLVPTVELDSAKPNPSVEFEIPIGGLLLHPNNFYLMHTLERVATKCYQPSLEGKSGIARLGIEVHLTAGWGEPGFDGQYTLEVSCRLPVRIYAGMRICQIKFETLNGEVVDYKNSGSYVGENASGPVASRSYTQFTNPGKP
jgi:dCTP deaminase